MQCYKTMCYNPYTVLRQQIDPWHKNKPSNNSTLCSTECFLLTAHRHLWLTEQVGLANITVAVSAPGPMRAFRLLMHNRKSGSLPGASNISN